MSDMTLRDQLEDDAWKLVFRYSEKYPELRYMTAAMAAEIARSVVGLALDSDLQPDENKLGPFQKDSDTSKKAALSNYPRSGTQRHRVLLFIAWRRDVGATREEIIDKTGISQSSCHPRVRELLDGGWLHVTERTRKTKLGEDAEVLTVSNKGLDWVQRKDEWVFL